MKITEVAAAVILQPDGRFLLGQRPEGKPYPGYWEFPGGKIEPGETPYQALVREIKEELDLTITRVTPWITLTHHYTHATVRLHFFKVWQWLGEPQGLEGQAFSWQHASQQDVSPMLPANIPLFRALSLPPHYAISNATEMGEAAYLSRLERALQHGLQLIQVREKNLPAARLETFARDVIAMARCYDAHVLINSDIELAKRVCADGVHLTSAQLVTLTKRPEIEWVGASAHTRDELIRAGQLGCDFAVLGPVQATLSHPTQSPMGWAIFTDTLRDTPIPVYALGGLKPENLSQAIECGAHGIAMQRALV